MTALDGAILVAFAAWSLSAGFRARRLASRGLEDYFLAGRTLSGWQAGLSMAATQFAADTPLLVTGLVATAGIFSLWRLWIYALAFLLLGFVLAASWRRARVVTDAELVELRYAGRSAAWLRALKAIYFGAIFNCAVLAMVLFAAKEIAEPFLLWHAWLPGWAFEPLRGAVAATGLAFARDLPGAGDVLVRSTDNVLSLALLVGVTTAYSASGGLRGVVRTDVVQLGLMLAGTALYAVAVVREVGGLAALHARLAAELADGGALGLSAEALLSFTPDRAPDAAFPVLAVIALQWLLQMNADGTGYLAQRVMACRSDAEARRATLVFTGVQILLRSLLWLPITLGLLLVLPVEPALSEARLAASREASFVEGMRRLLGPGTLGVMLTAMLAALASTVDTHLNWGASYFTNDLYRRFLRRGAAPSGRELVWVGRVATLVLLGLSLALMTQLGSIQTAWKTTLLLGAGMGVMLVLRWLWWRVSALGELAALAASLVLAPLALAALPDDAEAARLLLVGLGATAAGVAASLACGPEPEERLIAFYARVRPPGFWGPIAARAGGDPKRDAARLARGLAAVAGSALAIFALLVAVGSWLAGSRAPLFAPSRGLWLGGLLVLGAGLLPLSLRLGAAGDEPDAAPEREVAHRRS